MEETTADSCKWCLLLSKILRLQNTKLACARLLEILPAFTYMRRVQILWVCELSFSPLLNSFIMMGCDFIFMGPWYNHYLPCSDALQPWLMYRINYILPKGNLVLYMHVPFPTVSLSSYAYFMLIATFAATLNQKSTCLNVIIWNLFLFPGYNSGEFDRLISCVNSNLQSLARELRSKWLPQKVCLHMQCYKWGSVMYDLTCRYCLALLQNRTVSKLQTPEINKLQRSTSGIQICYKWCKRFRQDFRLEILLGLWVCAVWSCPLHAILIIKLNTFHM